MEVIPLLFNYSNLKFLNFYRPNGIELFKTFYSIVPKLTYKFLKVSANTHDVKSIFMISKSNKLNSSNLFRFEFLERNFPFSSEKDINDNFFNEVKSFFSNILLYTSIVSGFNPIFYNQSNIHKVTTMMMC